MQIRGLSAVARAHSKPAEHWVESFDKHKIKVYEKRAENADKCVVLLHGRTWSALPVWDLNAPTPAQPPQVQASEPLSFMDALVGHGFHVLAMDYRGFGATPRDESKWLTPDTCVKDTLAVIEWAKKRSGCPLPALVGWSQGGLIAQMLAQQHAEKISQVVLYGTIYHSSVVYQRPPILTQDQCVAPQKATTYEAAIEDFTLPGSISVEAIAAFGELALQLNPVKVDWNHYHEFNICNPAKITSPTLIIHGDRDPYVDLESMRHLFLGISGTDKHWVVLSDCDHCAHLLDTTRDKFARTVVSFLRQPMPQKAL